MVTARTLGPVGVASLVIGLALLAGRELLTGVWAGLWVFFVGTGLVLLLYSAVGSRHE